jgi:hypothetical protein
MIPHTEPAVLNIKELLAMRGLDTEARIKLVRHKDARHDLEDVWRKNLISLYQSYQSRPIFDGVQYVVSFIGMSQSKARLLDVHRVEGRKAASDAPLPAGFEFPWFMPDRGYFYTLRGVPGFDDLKGRVVIDWGRSAISWHQLLSEKTVTEVLPAGYVRDFPGYLDFVLPYPDLVEIIRNPDANREWHTMLRGVAGVYLITDTRTGNQYVGSAYGESGILGRWENYAKTGHGDNKQLRDLTSEVGYSRHFQFTVLRTLPKTLTMGEVIQFEILYKQKLGSRAFGLNSN